MTFAFSKELKVLNFAVLGQFSFCFQKINNRNMEEDKNKNEKPSKKKINRNSAVYLRQRKKANARKRKFLNKMTPEQREMKRAKDKDCLLYTSRCV